MKKKMIGMMTKTKTMTAKGRGLWFFAVELWNVYKRPHSTIPPVLAIPPFSFL